MLKFPRFLVGVLAQDPAEAAGADVTRVIHVLDKFSYIAEAVGFVAAGVFKNYWMKFRHNLFLIYAVCGRRGRNGGAWPS